MPDEEKKDLLDAIDDLDFDHERAETDDASGDTSSTEESEAGETGETDDKSGESKESKESEEEEPDEKEETSKEGETGETASDEKDSTEEGSEESKDKDEKGAEASKDLDEPSQVDILLKEINRLSGLVGQPSPVVKKEEKPAGSEEEKPGDKSESETAETDFVGELDMDDVASNPKILNAILNNVLKKGIELGQKLTADHTNLNIPRMVRDQVTHVSSFKEMIDEFYVENSDLSNVRAVVKACASQIIGESPEMLWPDVLNKAAENTRKTLGFKKPEKSEESRTSTDTSDAAFVESKGGSRKVKGQKGSKLQQELDEL